MKKFVALTLALALTAALSVSTFADTDDRFAPPAYPDDYKVYNPDADATTADNNRIPGWGYIGPDATITPNPDPEVEPGVVPEDLTKFLHVEVPTQFVWAAFQSDGGDVTAPTYKIVNKNEQANLQITMKSFVQAGGDNLPSGSSLTLNLTGDLALADVLNNNSHNYVYTSKLKARQEWQFSFEGNYSGVFPVDYVQPKYEMVLDFAVDTLIA